MERWPSLRALGLWYLPTSLVASRARTPAGHIFQVIWLKPSLFRCLVFLPPCMSRFFPSVQGLDRIKISRRQQVKCICGSLGLGL